MTTQVPQQEASCRSQDIQDRFFNDAMALAFGYFAERISSFSASDHKDFFELAEAAVQTESKEERASIAEAMREILMPESVSLVAGFGSATKGDDLKIWKDWIGSKIQQLRKEKGLSQVQLAKLACMDQSYVSRIENGDHSPSAKTRERIAKALGVPTAILDPDAD